MTDEERKQIQNEIENDLTEKIDAKVKDRFDSFRQFVDSAYTFHTSAIKNAVWIIGITLTIVSVMLTFFGIKTYTDIQNTIKSNVEKELSSDQVIKQYRDELTSLKSKLIINEIEQNIAVTNVYGKPYYRKTLSDEYLQILNEAINKKDENSIKCLAILNKYDDFVSGYENMPDKLREDIDKVSHSKNLIESVFAISNEQNNPLLQRESYEFLISYGTDQQVEKIINQLKNYISKTKTDYSSIFKDNAKDYLVRLIFKVKRNKKNTSNRKDIIEICKASNKFDDIEIKIVGLLGLATLNNDKIESTILQMVAQDKSRIDNLLSVTNSYSRYFYYRSSFFREEEQQVYNAKFLSDIFGTWALEKTKKRNYIYYDWLPLSKQQSLYNALFKQIIKKQKSADEILWVIKVFVPDDISVFNEKTFKELPILKVKKKGKYLNAYYDTFDDKLVDENNEKIIPDTTIDFSIQLKSNPNFDSNANSDDE